VAVQQWVKTRGTINEAKRLVERSRVLCSTAADLTRESNEIRLSIRRALERKRKLSPHLPPR